MEITRHFTATTFIVCQEKVLLHFHKKLKRWLPVGGHIERDELPLDAAIREVKEECGLEVTFANQHQELFESKDVKELLQPSCMLLENINPFHQHIDFVYFAKSETLEFDKNSEAAESLRWFDLSELESTSDMPEDVIKLSYRAVNFFYN
jgi:8-oxo-dGTP diphosphatase